MRQDDQGKMMREISLVRAKISPEVQVLRALPTKALRMVGPWCFVDLMGPGDYSLHTEQHPHTALQTLTWMIEGEMLHQDSLGYEQIIRPGQVNLMTAGHGISHTEDTMTDPAKIYAAQFWIALPPGLEDGPAAFEHVPEPPQWQDGEIQRTLLAGEFETYRANIGTQSPLVGVDLATTRGGAQRLALNAEFEHAVIVLSGQVQVGDLTATRDQFVALLAGQQEVALCLNPDTRCLLIGGPPREQPLHMWWNFVGPSRAYLEEAYAQWQARSERFGSMIPGIPSLDSPRPAWMKPE